MSPRNSLLIASFSLLLSLPATADRPSRVRELVLNAYCGAVRTWDFQASKKRSDPSDNAVLEFVAGTVKGYNLGESQLDLPEMIERARFYGDRGNGAHYDRFDKMEKAVLAAKAGKQRFCFTYPADVVGLPNRKPLHIMSVGFASGPDDEAILNGLKK